MNCLWMNFTCLIYQSNLPFFSFCNNKCWCWCVCNRHSEYWYLIKLINNIPNNVFRARMLKHRHTHKHEKWLGKVFCAWININEESIRYLTFKKCHFEKSSYSNRKACLYFCFVEKNPWKNNIEINDDNGKRSFFFIRIFFIYWQVGFSRFFLLLFTRAS